MAEREAFKKAKASLVVFLKRRQKDIYCLNAYVIFSAFSSFKHVGIVKIGKISKVSIFFLTIVKKRYKILLIAGI